MKQMLITVLLFVATITSYTQTRKLRASQTINEKSVVIYTNKACTIVFLKGELMNTFSYDVTTNWFLFKFEEEKQAALRAVALLKKEGPLTLVANDPHASADKKELASLIEQRLGAAPFLMGTIEVYDKNKKRQDTIEMVNDSKFYLRNSNTPFFVVGDQEYNINNVSSRVKEVATTPMLAINPEPVPANAHQVYTAVEQSPEYPGGKEKLTTFINDHLRYPEKDKLAGTGGDAWVSFIIEKDGSLTEIKCVKAPSEDIRQEAIRLIRESGNWTPGKQSGKTVRVRKSMTIRFTLPAEAKVI